MLIFDDKSQPYILESLNAPVVTDYMWVLDLQMSDFTMAPLQVLEEIVCPAIEVLVKGYQFLLPANWNILVCDRETSQLDIVELSEAAGRQFTAMTYGPNKSQSGAEIVTVTNYFIERTHIAPSLSKFQMLCHPIGPDEWIAVGPSDGFNKYLKDKIVGDLIGA